MKTPGLVNKKLKESKSESRLVGIVAIATIISVFCLVGAKTLFSEAAYQKRVLDARRAAVKQLNENVEAANSLSRQYQVFQTGNSTNIIGGKNSTEPNLQPPDGDNARIVLNAMPPQYDFPALLSSITKILNNNGIANQAVNGTDESANISSGPSADPKAATITIDVNGASNYKAVQAVIRDLERSIRPFDITKLDFRGSESSMAVQLTINTYFKPAVSLELTTKEIR